MSYFRSPHKIYSVDDPRFIHNERDYPMELPSLVMKVLRKYFLLPQTMNPSTPTEIEHSFINDHRTLLSIAVPALLVQICWWIYMSVNNLFYLFDDDVGDSGRPRYLVSITMMFGSAIAGATSEGGATIAFPVLTLLFNVSPSVARDFGFMIQSIGMSTASLAIFFMNVKLEYKALLYCTLGGTLGVVFGLEHVAPQVTPSFTKMYFVCVWFSFSLALYWLSFRQRRKVYEGIPYWDYTRMLPGIVLDFGPAKRQVIALSRWLCGTSIDDDDASSAWDSTDTDLEQSMSRQAVTEPDASTILIRFHWKAIVLFFTGFVGGICSAMGGSGLDICSFSVLTLLFCVSERVATPTSIVLMALNSIVAFLWRDLYSHAIDPESWRMWLCCVPVVCICAPLGALLMSHWHRLVIAFLVVVIGVAQLVGALYVIRPWTNEHTKHPLELCLISSLLMLVSGVGFFLLAMGGTSLLSSFTALPFDLREIEEQRLADSVVNTGQNAELSEVRSAADARNGNNHGVVLSKYRYFKYNRKTLQRLAVLNENETSQGDNRAEQGVSIPIEYDSLKIPRER